MFLNKTCLHGLMKTSVKFVRIFEQVSNSFKRSPWAIMAMKHEGDVLVFNFYMNAHPTESGISIIMKILVSLGEAVCWY